MSRYLISETQYKRILETGSNSVAMDLDIYTSVNTQPTDSGNLDTEETIKNIIDRLNELLSMIKTGKEVDTNSKTELSKALDLINKGFSQIKFGE